jgi:hypothetical protein
VKKTVKVDGSPEIDFVLKAKDLGRAVRLLEFPEGVRYELSLPGDKDVVIPQGAQGQPVEILLTPIEGERGDPIHHNGSVQGQLVLDISPDGLNGSEKPGQVVIDFRAEQKASVDNNVQWLLVAVLFVVGVGLTLGSVIFVTWLVGKFPSEKFIQNNGLRPRYAMAAVQFTKDGLLETEQVKELFTNQENFEFVRFSSRRLALIGSHRFKVKTHGLSLSSVGHGEISGKGIAGFSTESSKFPGVGLSLPTGYVFFSSDDDLELVSQGMIGTGTVVVLSQQVDDSKLGDARDDFVYNFSQLLLPHLPKQVKKPNVDADPMPSTGPTQGSTPVPPSTQPDW